MYSNSELTFKDIYSELESLKIDVNEKKTDNIEIKEVPEIDYDKLINSLLKLKMKEMKNEIEEKKDDIIINDINEKKIENENIIEDNIDNEDIFIENIPKLEEVKTEEIIDIPKINVFEFKVPSLEDTFESNEPLIKKDDIPALDENFLDRLSDNNKKMKKEDLIVIEENDNINDLKIPSLDDFL